MQLLLKANADVNQANNIGWTPLQQALACNHLAIATLLVAFGATVDLNRYDPGTPKRAAVQRGLQLRAYVPLLLAACELRLGRSLRATQLPASLVALVGEYAAVDALEAVRALDRVLLRPDAHPPETVAFMFLHGGGLLM